MKGNVIFMTEIKVFKKIPQEKIFLMSDVYLEHSFGITGCNSSNIIAIYLLFF
jgi:hypothetical protein